MPTKKIAKKACSKTRFMVFSRRTAILRDISRPVRLSVRTPDFHSGKGGSIPPRVAIMRFQLLVLFPAFPIKNGKAFLLALAATISRANSKKRGSLISRNFRKFCPRQESNLHFAFRRGTFDPLNYAGVTQPQCAEKCAPRKARITKKLHHCVLASFLARR